jgi:hypothetical protein
VITARPALTSRSARRATSSTLRAAFAAWASACDVLAHAA